MDDKKFEEIMHEYVASKSRGKNADFNKLYQNEKSKTPKKYNYKLVLASISCILVVAITLAIVLPLTLQPSDVVEPITPPPAVYYCDLEDIESIVIDTLTDIKTEYSISATMPNIEYQDIGITMMKSKIDSHIIGTSLDLAVYDEYFDDVIINIVFENNIINTFSSYETSPHEVEWKGKSVKYIVEYNDDDFSYNATIFFTKDGYKYYLDACYYEDLPVTDILDKIF